MISSRRDETWKETFAYYAFRSTSWLARILPEMFGRRVFRRAHGYPETPRVRLGGKRRLDQLLRRCRLGKVKKEQAWRFGEALQEPFFVWWL